MLTAQQLVYAMLEYVGEFSLTFSEYTDTAATGLQRALVLAINEGVAELFRLNPALFKREVGVLVLGPIAGSIAVTQGSVTVTSPSFTGGPASFAGQTIQITGQTGYNQLRTEGGTHKLVYPYTGNTGTVAATLYGDALALDSGYSRPLGPVWLSDIRILTPLNGKPELLSYDPRQDLRTDWGRYPFGVNRTAQPKLICQPEAYFADVHTLEAGTAQVRLFLTPLPEKTYPLRFDFCVKPLPVTWETDIGDSDDADPARAFPLPDTADETWLKPLVLYAFSRSAFFKNDLARKQIAADRAAILPAIEAWKVQPQTGGHLAVGGWR